MKLRFWHIILFIVISILFLMCIWILLRYVDLSSFSTEGVGRANWLAFLVAYIGAASTLLLGYIAYKQNKVLEIQNEKSLKYNERLLQIEENNKKPVLTVKNGDAVTITDKDEYVEIFFTLYNSGNSPITELRVINEVNTLKESVKKSKEYAQTIKSHGAHTVAAASAIAKLLPNASKHETSVILSSIKNVEKFLLNISDVDANEIASVTIYDILNAPTTYTGLKNHCAYFVKSLRMICDDLEPVFDVMLKLETQSNKIMKELDKLDEVYSSLQTLHSFGKFLTEDLCYVDVAERVMQSIKIPVLLRETKDVQYMFSQVINKDDDIMIDKNSYATMHKDAATIYGVTVWIEFKNIHGTWFEEKLDVEVHNGQVKRSALIVEPIRTIGVGNS